MADPRPTALNHIHLTAADPVAELTFLVDVLGFRRDGTHPGIVWIGNTQVAVSKGEPIQGGRFHMGFRLDNQDQVDALRAHLREQGIETSEPFASGSYYSCAFQDPAGYQFEVFADAGIPALGTLTE